MLIDGLARGAIAIESAAGGRIALVTSRIQGSLRLGYCLAPVVVTETLWALVADPARAKDERFVPDEVHVLTTAAGYTNAREALFSPGERIDAFCREHAIPRFPLTVRQVGHGEAEVVHRKWAAPILTGFRRAA